MEPPKTLDEAKLWAVVIGAAGAVASLTFLKDLTWPQKSAMVVFGTVMSVLFTQPVIDLVAMPAAWSNGVAFLVGMFGMNLAWALTSMVRSADLWGLVSDVARSWFARKGG